MKRHNTLDFETPAERLTEHLGYLIRWLFLAVALWLTIWSF